MPSTFNEIAFLNKLRGARDASRILALSTTGAKNAALEAIARQLEQNVTRIVTANGEDLRAGEANGLDAHLLDRLMLNESRIHALAEAVRSVIAAASESMSPKSKWPNPGAKGPKSAR